MASQGSTMFTIGTLLRHAMDAGASVRVLVGGTWLEGVLVGADGHGIVLDDGEGHQVLARLEAVLAVTFSPSHIEPSDEDSAQAQHPHEREPIEAGPVGG